MDLARVEIEVDLLKGINAREALIDFSRGKELTTHLARLAAPLDHARWFC
jgi:hypothetical protein